MKICIDFIDEFKSEVYSPEKYTRLQLRIQEVIGIELISIRKDAVKIANELLTIEEIKSFIILTFLNLNNAGAFMTLQYVFVAFLLPFLAIKYYENKTINYNS